jgi:hypothetical protein
MLKILGEHYYVDLDRIDEYLQIKPTVPLTGETDSNHISIIKYETVKLMLDVIMDDGGDVDENLGVRSSDMSLSFKLAFNTLLNKKIINKY